MESQDRLTNYEVFLLVKKNWTFLKHVKDQTEELCLEAIRQNSNALQYVKCQTHKMCIEAVRQNPHAIALVTYKSPSLCMEAIIQDPQCLQYVPSYLQTNDICMEALKKDGNTLKYIENQTVQMCIKSLETSGGQTFTLIKNKTDVICKAAVKIDGLLLFHVPEQTYEIILEAVKQNPMAIRYCNFSILGEQEAETIIIEAIKVKGEILKYLDKKYHTKNVCLFALEMNRNNINFIKNDDLIISNVTEQKQGTINNSILVVNKNEIHVIKTNVKKNTAKILGVPTNTMEEYIDNFINNKKNKEQGKEGAIQKKYHMVKVDDYKYEIYETCVVNKSFLYFYNYDEEITEKIYMFELYNSTRGFVI